MNTPRILRGRMRMLALGSAFVLGACTDATPTASDAAGPPRGPDLLIGTTAGLVAERPIAAGALYALALRPDGTVAGWGFDGYVAPMFPWEQPEWLPTGTHIPAGLTGVVALSAYGSHALALRADGTVVGWGYNAWGQASPPTLSGVVAISTGEDHSLAVRNDGTVAAWGRNDCGQAAVPLGLSDVVAVEGGYYHSLALRRDGTVVGWGCSPDGRASPPSGLSDVVALAAGVNHSVAVRRDGTVVGWGGWSNVVPAGLTDVVAVDAGSHHTIALKRDGTVVAWASQDEYGATRVPVGLSGVVAVAAGYGQSMALKRDGTVVIWGNHYYGQLNLPPGLVGRVPNSAPVAHGVTSPAGMVSGHRYTFVVNASDPDNDALTYAWDMNSDGSPEQTSSLAGIYYAFPSGGTHTVRVTVTDAKGVGVQQSVSVAVEQNVAPQASITPIATVVEGAVAYPRATVTDANSATDLAELKYVTYRWSFGDGTLSTSATPSKRYNDSGTYPVTLTVTDRGGASSTTQAQAQVTNAPPRATLVAPASVLGAGSFALQATSVTDPGPDDRASLKVAFNCGTGYAPYTRDLLAGVRCATTLPRGARLTVGLRVRDKDGAVAEYVRNYTLK
jgi:trimeric autotransporter adhesin